MPPPVSVILTTRDRPRFLPLALEAYRRQKYADRELIVVDDGELHPATREAVERVGGRLLRLQEPATLGTKLNLGVEAARGVFCVKMDDDDWYGPRYVETMVTAIHDRSVETCRPTIAFLTPFLFFDIASWVVRRSDDGNVPGATLVFAREDWAEAPFRGLSSNEDMWFYRDQLALGVAPLPVRAPEIYLAVRHTASTADRAHTWDLQWHGEELDSYLLRRPVYRRPESLLPRWATAAYKELRRELLTASESSA